jgi:hypothetical protein
LLMRKNYAAKRFKKSVRFYLATTAFAKNSRRLILFWRRRSSNFFIDQGHNAPT